MATASKPAQTSEFVDSIVQLSFAVQGVLTRVAAEQHLSMSQVRLLGILRDRTPPMTAIAEHLGLDRSSVTGLVDRAERRGLVARTSSSRDARVTIVGITSTGMDVARRLSAMVTTELDALAQRVAKTDRDCIARVARACVDEQVRRELAGSGR